MNVLQFIRLSPVDVMRLSLGAWWPEGRSSSSISQFLPSCSWSACQMQQSEKTVTGVIWALDYFCSSAFAAFEVDVLQRGGQTLRCAQLSARLSAELCSPDLWRYYTTLRCTESIHFLWPLNRKFSGLLVRPWISSAVADGTVFAWLSWPVFECVQSRCRTKTLSRSYAAFTPCHNYCNSERTTLWRSTRTCSCPWTGNCAFLWQHYQWLKMNLQQSGTVVTWYK